MRDKAVKVRVGPLMIVALVAMSKYEIGLIKLNFLDLKFSWVSFFNGIYPS